MKLFANPFKNRGHEVEILSFSLQYPSVLFPGKTQKDTSSGPPAGVKIHSLINSVNPLNWIRAAKFIRNYSADLIILQFWIPFIALSFGQILRLVGRKKPRTIAVCHNVIPHESHPGASCLTKSLLKRCDGYIVLSEAVLGDLDKLKMKGEKVYHPHPLYDMYGDKVVREKAAAHFKLDPAGKYLLFFGLIREYKGLDITLKAIGDQRIKSMGVKLIVAGEFYEDEKKYMDLVRELELENNVIFVKEYIPKYEVGYYFGLADMVVQTYKTATQSGVTQVAYHFDKPMLVTNVGGLAEIVPHGKVGYVTEKDPKAVSDAIVDFYENNRAAEFFPNMVEEKKRFSWDSFVNKILQMRILVSKTFNQ
jgi:D-inositol-3-phosphate glycosyltransferase